MSHRYRDLIVWQKAKATAVDVYRISERFPKAEIYGLTSQIRRAAISVPSNIAEGQGRLTKGESSTIFSARQEGLCSRSRPNWRLLWI
ncbi:MAG TPA: four helix bundle protein [Terriglobales bacterium]|nr:four helix bundle protein [Terriglobales bacterium]